MRLWIQTLNHELRDSTLTICKNVGKGFSLLSGDNKNGLNNALMLSSFRSKWSTGTCLIQSWIPGFNLDNRSNLAFPTWVSLRNMPFEHQVQALAIARSLGEVIGMDTANEHAKDPRFCINLKMNKWWITSLDLESKVDILTPQKIMVDYDKLPIRCRVCLSWKHKSSECKEYQKKPIRGRGKPIYAHNIQDKKKAKTFR